MDMAAKKILFVLFEGLPGTVIDSQVLIHAKLVREHLSIEVEVWAFACTESVFNASEKRLEKAKSISGSEVKLIKATRPSLPYSYMCNARLIENLLKDRAGEFFAIHARTDYSAAVLSRLSHKVQLPIIWDCRGDSGAEFEAKYKNAAVWKKPLIAYRKSQIEKERISAGKACKAAIFVSNPLKLKNEAFLENKVCEVIPCAASKNTFFFKAALRYKKREELGLKSDDVLYIYSGGMSFYQCFPETVQKFQDILQQNKNAKLLVLTPSMEAARPHLDMLPENSWMMYCASINEVNEYLNAADIAFMLRHDIELNRVASPTKFAEYALSGLPVIMTRAVADSAEIAQRLNNFCDFNSTRFLPIPDAGRLDLSQNAQEILSREAILRFYEKIYTSVSV
ncbi:hypothetical protein [Terasakiella pusilla]|uniref:hypothetical protein n=1 Tax=Terasakiella pusilla TaxID=64973 RepID=UPI003AA7DA36